MYSKVANNFSKKRNLSVHQNEKRNLSVHWVYIMELIDFSSCKRTPLVNESEETNASSRNTSR